MADINKRLLTAKDNKGNDIPAPQQKVKGKNDFEFTEGSHGAQHTKIVDASGQPADIDAELKSIKRMQAEILDRLDKGIDTRLTGSNVEEEFVERFIFDGSKNTTNYVFPPENTRGAIVSVTIHGATGDYSSGKGFRPRLLNYVLGNRSANRALEISTEWLKSSEGIYQFYLYPGIDLKDADTRNKYNKFYTSHVFVPSVLGLFFDIDGVLSEDEGFDVSAKVMWLR